ncbi:MAG: dihydrodipicolinate synthase family protein [Rhodospirillales bacterium]|nr:MAG: dihydrodipicolinate synthase family protein [Rhodospirillales bacterium]
MTPLPEGVLAAVLTPLQADLAPDHGRLRLHCRWLLEHGCDALVVLGTTGEANSFSVEERLDILESLVEGGIPGGVLLAGTGCCAVPDTVRLTRRAVALGLAGVLVLPPFYYKGVSDDGLFAAYAQLIDTVGEGRLRVYLYHFPQLSGVPLTHGLIARLLKAYPDTIVGIKDSAGDLGHMLSLVREFPGLAVFSGADELLLPLLRGGGAGCITGVANVAAPLSAEARRCFVAGDADAADRAHQALSRVRHGITAYPLTAALKAVMAEGWGDDGWRRVRPPLVPLAADDADRLMASLATAGLPFRRAAGPA